MKTPPDIILSDGRVVTVADNPSVDGWGSYRKILVGNPEFPRSFEVAGQVKSGDDLAVKMAEIAEREEALSRDFVDQEDPSTHSLSYREAHEERESDIPPMDTAEDLTEPDRE